MLRDPIPPDDHKRIVDRLLSGLFNFTSGGAIPRRPIVRERICRATLLRPPRQSRVSCGIGVASCSKCS